MSCYGHNHVGTLHSLKSLLYTFIYTQSLVTHATPPSITNSVGMQMDWLGFEKYIRWTSGNSALVSKEFREYNLKEAII